MKVMMSILRIMIGCTILRAVSGIPRTQRGRRGSGPGRQLAGATCARPAMRGWAGHHHLWPLLLLSSPPWLNSRPRGSTPPLLAPWLNTSPLWLNTLSPGRRRRIATSQWPWAYSLGCSPACQIKPDHISAVVIIGVQWSGLGLARFAGGLPTRPSRDLGGSGASGPVLCSCVFSWAVAGVADRQRHAASRDTGLSAA